MDPNGPEETQRLTDWLIDRLVTPDGAVLSWENASHSGYRYPEAAGLLLTLLAGDERPHARAASVRIVSWLSSLIRERGAVGRGDRLYAFDTAMVLRGLLSFVEAGGELPDETAPHRCFRFLVETINAGQATDAPTGEAARWSNTLSCHLMKLSFALRQHELHEPMGNERDLALRLFDKTLQSFCEGRFRTAPGDRSTYLHAHCYAVEGLLCMRAWKLADESSVLEACAEWLEHIQRVHGGIPAWHDGRRGAGPSHADATAQAIRIWSCLDRDRWAKPIALATRWIRQNTSPNGGVWYSPDCRDQNTWASIFAAQAVRFASGAADPLEIV